MGRYLSCFAVWCGVVRRGAVPRVRSDVQLLRELLVEVEAFRVQLDLFEQTTECTARRSMAWHATPWTARRGAAQMAQHGTARRGAAQYSAAAHRWHSVAQCGTAGCGLAWRGTDGAAQHSTQRGAARRGVTQRGMARTVGPEPHSRARNPPALPLAAHASLFTERLARRLAWRGAARRVAARHGMAAWRSCLSRSITQTFSPRLDKK